MIKTDVHLSATLVLYNELPDCPARDVLGRDLADYSFDLLQRARRAEARVLELEEKLAEA